MRTVHLVHRAVARLSVVGGGQREGNRKYFLNFEKNLQNKLENF